MKLHLPKSLRVALLATFTVLASLGSAASAATYNNLTTVNIDAENNVYYDGKGTFYVQSPQISSLDVTIDLNQFNNYQHSNDYTGFTPFVTWTFATGLQDGIADVSTKNNAASYSGLTGFWGTGQYALSGNGQNQLTLDTLRSYATGDLVTVTVQNNITGGVSLTIGSGASAVTYQNTGLRFSGQNTQTTAYSVNLNYVTSVTLNTASTLDTDSFELPPDYSQPFHSDRWDAHDQTSFGRVLFVGDSITHGVGEQTWRWQIFKTMVDNGIENEIAGPRSDYDTRFANTTSDRGMTSYAGEEFNNVHLAQSSGRTHNIITGSANISGVNYGGWSTSKTAASYDADTMVCLMGTNDLLSDGGAYLTKFAKLLGGTVTYDEASKHYTWTHDPSSASSQQWGEWGTMGTIMADLMKQQSDTMYVMSIPTWGVRNDLAYGPNGNVSVETGHHGVEEYNALLKQWTVAYSAATHKNVNYVEINTGLVDLTDSVSFKGYTGFFRGSGDQLHPTEQGSLIIAGNLAKGMGLAGRTAGLERSAVGLDGRGWQNAEASISLRDGQTVKAIADAFHIADGYTIDFKAVFGDGATGGWKNSASALSINIGDGTNGGTLKLSEGYVMWGDTVLFCQDNHLTTNDNFRVAYTAGDSSQNIGGGYYVWLGDMLIGQALNAGSSTLNGVTLNAQGGSASVTGLAFTDKAYAPSTSLITANPNGLTSVTPPPSQPDQPLVDMPASERDMIVAPTTIGGTPLTQQYAVTANNGQSSVNLTGSNATWNGAVSSAGHKGDVNVEVVGNATSANLFGVVQGTVQKSDATGDTGSVKMVLGNNVVVGQQNFGANWDGATAPVAIAGAFMSSIEGTFALELNQTSVGGDIIMGVLNARNLGSVGATELTMNAGAVVNGNIYGGSYDSHGVVQGNASITINGGTVDGSVEGGGKTGTVEGGNGTIKGDVSIAINGGVITKNVSIGGGTIEGNSTVTVTGNKASIGGNITVEGDKGKVVLNNVSDSGYTDGFDRYANTISAATLELNKYTASEVHAALVGQHLVVQGNSATNVSNLHLTACDITVEKGSTLTLSGEQHFGHTTSYSGDGSIAVANGTVFTVDEPTVGVRPGDYTSGANGFRYEGYVYDVLKPGTTGHLLGGDGKELGLTTCLTLVGKGAIDGAFFVYKADTGILSAYETLLPDTCYINTGSLTYGKETGAYGATTSLEVKSGATLVMADNLAAGVTINSHGGTVDVHSGVELSKASFAANSTATLTGAGSFTLDAATTVAQMAMPQGITLDSEAWKGTVLVTTNGTAVENISAAALNALTPNEDAWLQLSKVSGWLENDNVTFNSNIRLVGDGALNLTSGWGNLDYTFTGDIAGDGSFINGYDGGNFIFTGDISQWIGSISSRESSGYDRAMSLKLAGDATTLNAAVFTGARGPLNMTLGAITNGAEGYTFQNEVHVSSLSGEGQNLTLAGPEDVHPAASLEVSGATTLAKLTLEDGASASFAGDVNLTNGVVAGSGASVSFNGSNVWINDDSVAAFWRTNIDAEHATVSFGPDSDVHVSGTMNIGTLHVDGAVSMADHHDKNYVESALFHNLSSGADAHLTLASSYTTWRNTTYTIGAADTDANANQFHGTIELKRDSASTGVSQLIIANTDIAQDAVIALNNANAGSKFGIGLNASTVKVKGITDVDGSKGGSIFLGNSYEAPATDVHTLQIMGDGSYATSAELSANLNLTMSGTGTQTFNGNLNAVNGTMTANGGHLVLANSAAEPATANLSGIFINDGVLELSGGKYAVGSSKNTNGLFAQTGAVKNGALVLSNGASLEVDAKSASWHFQVNSGAGAGVYVKGEDSNLVANLWGNDQVSFKALDTNSATGAHLIANGTGKDFTLATTDITVADAEYTVNGGSSAKTVSNKLQHSTITNAGTGVLTVNNSANTLAGVKADKGDVVVRNAANSAASMESIFAVGGDVTIEELGENVMADINELYIGADRTVSAYIGVPTADQILAAQNGTKGIEGTITVTGTLTAGEGATLNADLVLGTKATIDFAGTEGLHMGSSLTLQSGSKIELGDSLRDALANLTIDSDGVVLFTGVDHVTIGGQDYDDALTYWASQYFNLAGLENASDMSLHFDAEQGGTVSIRMENKTPEPATATLSLLALAALAARRKRK